MKLNKFLKTLNRERLSESDRENMKELKSQIDEFIKNTNLDEVNRNGSQFFDYTKSLKKQINSLIESYDFGNEDEVRSQIFKVYEIK